MSNPITSPTAAGTVPAVLDGQAVYDTVPLGAVLRYFDGTPQPPARFTRKLHVWRSRNGTGRLVEKSLPSTIGNSTYPAGFTLDQGSYGSNGVTVLTVRTIYQVTTAQRFEVIEWPQPGMVRVLHRRNGRDELKYLAPDMAAAEAWMQRNRYSNLVTKIVGAAELSANLGRAA
ncbi:hypothetical protein DFR49_2593 [Hephaestia caeni]|uniref:Uncharacterized protein n=1 Tax=Hephaestia caeni TaxID=645617 RepID=A0A397PF97_9SPHN|nr:hypothetical protein [Hephaestia caeni]RIA44351.1 hypothetical protein DFR49_2593 [Hephaestia caeni]